MGKRENPGWHSGAVFDLSGKYRYTLWRVWRTDAPRATFIMLNPSTADAYKNDSTITRCIAFASTWNFGSLEVVNLFAYRATHPRELFNADDPIGPENDSYLLRAIARSSCIVAAWGTKGTLLGRDLQVLQLLGCCHASCLGLTKEGHPRHPLYLKGNTSLMALPFLKLD
jgi:hypothetical protein